LISKHRSTGFASTASKRRRFIPAARHVFLRRTVRHYFFPQVCAVSAYIEELTLRDCVLANCRLMQIAAPPTML
jgi:hypothetical protein